MRTILRREGLALLLLLASVGLVAWYWPRLPESIPTHWDVSGEPNQYMPRAIGAFLGPLLGAVMYGLLFAVPAIDPRWGVHAKEEASGIDLPAILRTLFAAFALFMTYTTLSAATQPHQTLAVGHLGLAMGLMFVVLGNYLPKVRSNFFIGVRTPWTLSNEEVWYRTQRVAGRFMVGAGLVMMAGAWLSPWVQFALVIGSAAGLAVLSVAYSYWLYVKLQGRAS